MKTVTGKTHVVGVIGHPIEHSLSPIMHNAEFERAGLDYVYVPWGVDPANLEEALKGLMALGVAGFNITIPHKQKIMPFLDEITEEARLIGAVNTVSIRNARTIGYNTDVHGWIQDIQQDVLLEGTNVCVIGAGGAARAVCVGAAMAKAARVFICNRSLENAEAMGEVLQEHFPGTKFRWSALKDNVCRQRFRKCEVVVNATPVGMTQKPGTPVPAEWTTKEQYVYDTIYAPAETDLLTHARKLGCSTRNGLGMLARQGAISFEIWTGKKPSVTAMQTALKRALEEPNRE